MEWMIKTNLVILLLASVYQVSLRGTTHFLFNRIYLLSIPVFALLLPASTGWFVSLQPVYSVVLRPVTVGVDTLNNNPEFSSTQLLLFIYAAGVLVSFCLFCVRLYKALFRFHAGNTAHSFFHQIYLPASDEQHRSMMHLHETAHVRLWHSADVLYYQLLQCVFWFNPAVHYLGKALAEVNEYSADRYATERLSDKVAYCELLLNETFGAGAPGITNTFHTKSSIIKRITMITQTNKQSVSGWKYVAMLPFMALALFFSGAPYLFAQDTKPAKEKSVTVIDQLPEFNGDLFKYLADEIKYPESARKEKVEGRVVLQFVVNAKGKIESIRNVTPKVDERLVKEAIRVVSAMPAWKPGMNKGKAVSAEMTLPIQFKL